MQQADGMCAKRSVCAKSAVGDEDGFCARPVRATRKRARVDEDLDVTDTEDEHEDEHEDEDQDRVTAADDTDGGLCVTITTDGRFVDAAALPNIRRTLSTLCQYLLPPAFQTCAHDKGLWHVTADGREGEPVAFSNVHPAKGVTVGPVHLSDGSTVWTLLHVGTRRHVVPQSSVTVTVGGTTYALLMATLVAIRAWADMDIRIVVHDSTHVQQKCITHLRALAALACRANPGHRRSTLEPQAIVASLLGTLWHRAVFPGAVCDPPRRVTAAQEVVASPKRRRQLKRLQKRPRHRLWHVVRTVMWPLRSRVQPMP
jgi:hypothetical protein